MDKPKVIALKTTERGPELDMENMDAAIEANMEAKNAKSRRHILE